MPNLNTLIKASNLVSPPQSPRTSTPRQCTLTPKPLQESHARDIAHALLALNSNQTPQSKRQLSFNN